MNSTSRLYRDLFTTICTFLVITCTPLNALAKDLTGDEVATLISGNTVEAIHVSRGYKITTYYAPDGSYIQLSKGKRQQGKWHIDDNGCLCKQRGGKGGECRLIVEDGAIWKAYKIPRNMMKQRKHKRDFIKITQGNPNKL
ncbi:MAG: hypothetical protein AB2719_06630 [Candidatus Thiodiazotropha sp.]